MPKTLSPIRVLHLEDSPRDAELIQGMCEIDGLHCEMVVADTRERYESALADSIFDLVLCDFNLPGFDGHTALRLAKRIQPATPVIMVSGVMDAHEAVDCLTQGATDYLLKERLERLPSAVRRALEESEQRRQREAMGAKLRESEEMFRQLAEQSSDGFWFVGLNPERVLYVSPATEAIWGVSAEAVYQDPRAWVGKIVPGDRERVLNLWESWAADRVSRFEVEHRVVHSDGSVRLVLTTGAQIRDDAGRITRLSGLTSDITERKELEARFRQAQKMESVGRLAGGIAHDFNNLLTVINGMAEFSMERLREDDPMRRDLQEILSAGERGAALTRQLLAFSRKQILELRIINLNTVISQMQSLIRRLLGEDIEVVFTPAADLGHVKADPGQIEQVVANLVVNARDAMPQGGTLTIDTHNVELDASDARRFGVAFQPGPYVLFSISDTGTGMDAATLGHIFEPFFTTKEPGKGTGLGLSTVYGIVQQSDGLIFATSEPGQGARFTIYLPRVSDTESVAAPKPTSTATRGSETVLLVEDNEGLRKLAKRMLESAGYVVLAAAAADEALSILERSEASVQLLLTDVVMPGLSGRALAQQAVQLRPGLKVLYTSGYTEDTIAHHGVLNEATFFIAKPFTRPELSKKVREILDS